MAQRRIKSLMFGSAPSTRVYHHEHRSRKNRRPKYEYKEAAKHRLSKENFKRRQMKSEADFVMKKLNYDSGE